MSDYTKADSELMNWTQLSGTGAGTPFVESSELDMSDGDMITTLHIDFCRYDNNAASDKAGCVVLVKGGTTDEDWHEFRRFEMDDSLPTERNVDQASNSGQPNLYIDSTVGFESPGDKYFVGDVGSVTDSCIVVNKDVVTNDYIICMDNLPHTYTITDNVYNVLEQWDVKLPGAVSKVKVIFFNPDADATYACRVQVSQTTDLE